MRISDWSSDLCSSDLTLGGGEAEICRVGANGRESAGGSADGRDVGSGRNARHGAPRNRGTEGWRCLGRRGRSGRAEKALRGGRRSEERRGGTECVSKGRSRWGPYY